MTQGRGEVVVWLELTLIKPDHGNGLRVTKINRLRAIARNGLAPE